jgi:hypothetical protein
MQTLSGAVFAVLVAALAGAVSSPAQAAITQYECTFRQEGNRGGGWIPEVVFVTENDQNGEIIVYDPVIDHFVGSPIPARRTDVTDVRRTFRWEVKFQNKGQSGRMIYALTYRTNGVAASMKALPGGFDNSWSGDGSCKVTTG